MHLFVLAVVFGCSVALGNVHDLWRIAGSVVLAVFLACAGVVLWGPISGWHGFTATLLFVVILGLLAVGMLIGHGLQKRGWSLEAVI